jgi:sulfate transport system ATP-binding protein
MSIEIKNISKSFGAFQALKDVNLTIPSGELVALLGPSGSGKTTLLRIIAGLEEPDAGTILTHGEDFTRHSPRERNMGFVFQHYALFAHMTIFENIAFGLRVRGEKGPKVTERVRELLDLIHLSGLEKRYPSQLSGGQRQRVALARALAPQPRALLLDEPFGALDAKVRQDLRRWIRKVHQQNHMTSVFVTHDQEEAFEVADRVVVMSRGRIEQVGTPDEVFAHPANEFVLDFLGGVNVFHGRVHEGLAHVGDLRLPYLGYQGEAPIPAKAYVRNHEIEIAHEPYGDNSLRARVAYVNRSGGAVKVGLLTVDSLGANSDDETIDVELDHRRYNELKIKTGDEVYLVPRKVRVFSDAA